MATRATVYNRMYDSAPAPLRRWLDAHRVEVITALCRAAARSPAAGPCVAEDICALPQAMVGLPAVPGPASQPLFDADGRKYLVSYWVVETAVDGSGPVVPSHEPGTFRWTEDYPRAFQARTLEGGPEQAKIRTMGRNLDPDRLLGKTLAPTEGPPLVWPGSAHPGRLFVLAGNGRVLAFLLAPEERHRDYHAAGRRQWSCWPDRPASPGRQWLLVRVVHGLDFPSAVRLAAASQESTAGGQTTIGRALGLVRSLAIEDVTALGSFTWAAPIDAGNIGDFAAENPAWWRNLVLRLPEYRRPAMADPAQAAGLVNQVLVGYLPPAAHAGVGTEEPEVEKALMGLLPFVVSLHGEVVADNLPPEWDLLPHVGSAFGVWRYARERGLSVARLVQAAEESAIQVGFTYAGEEYRDVLAQASPLGFCLAVVLHRAAARLSPGEAVAQYLTPYLEAAQAAAARRAQEGMFGPVEPLDPAAVLTDILKVRLPAR